MSAYNNSKPKFLDSLVANQKLTADGRDWLILALDPFHDLNHQAAGYPDADGSQTVVSCFQYQTDVTVPAGVAGNWDCHVFTTPKMVPTVDKIYQRSADWSVITETANTCAIGPLTIVTAATGAYLGPTIPIPATTKFASLPAAGNLDLVDGVTRVIGMGYEVTNTTAEINKQGTVTSYRMPQYGSKVGSVVRANLANNRAEIATQGWLFPPMKAEYANLLKGTRTWDAASGVYATAVLNSVENPLTTLSSTATMMQLSVMGGIATDVTLSPVTEVNNNPFPDASLDAPTHQQCMPYDTTGSIFTGLSNATTLTVKVKFYVERAPMHWEPKLSVLATPSAGYDTIALELYSHAISQLPVAVTVAENGIGDWFRGVVNVLKTVAGGATAVLGGIVPGASEVGNAVQTVLGRMDSFLGPKQDNSVMKQAIQAQANRLARARYITSSQSNSTSSSQPAKKKKNKPKKQLMIKQ